MPLKDSRKGMWGRGFRGRGGGGGGGGGGIAELLQGSPVGWEEFGVEGERKDVAIGKET